MAPPQQQKLFDVCQMSWNFDPNGVCFEVLLKYFYNGAQSPFDFQISQESVHINKVKTNWKLVSDG
jgi:hypothetical protein